ncbi:MAG: citrate/2-methylcitrate synthase [Clostridia bacterium]|nr:citrate/2-methylcitrate synthase [Clostridia bacterium]
MARTFNEITPYIEKMARVSEQNNCIRPQMYIDHEVKRGLRDLDGRGVVTGLTEISKVNSRKTLPDGTVVPCEGELCYRGINIKDITDGFLKENRFGFEETVYTLLFSDLPTSEQLSEFTAELSKNRSLSPVFVRDIILKAPSRDMMNSLSKSVLAAYSYDKNPDDISVENVLRQCLLLIAAFPALAIYSYHAYRHFHLGKTLYIRNPKPQYSTAENILYMLRKDGNFTHLEAKVLDLALVLHAEHGGGNNSTFTTHVVTSSGTDTYSAISAALGSLKGPRHGGANIKVVQMFDDMKKSIDVKNDDEIKEYLVKLLDKQAFDRLGLIYGMGHAVYSISDPRSDILRDCARELAVANGKEKEFVLYSKVAEFAPEIIGQKRKVYKGVSPNVDFYSGLIYRMLDLPCELFTPMFAIARIAGWSAHRIEEIENAGKIIRPAYINVKEDREYIPIEKR